MKVSERVNLFLKKEGYAPEAHEVCPRQDCSVNKCPLHKHYSSLESNPADIQTKCRCPKRIRLEIGTFFNLPNKGLTSREFSAAKIWENMPESEREAKRAELAKKSVFLHLKRKGYAITRICKDTPEITLAKSKDGPKTPIKTACSELITRPESNDSHSLHECPESRQNGKGRNKNVASEEYTPGEVKADTMRTSGGMLGRATTGKPEKEVGPSYQVKLESVDNGC